VHLFVNRRRVLAALLAGAASALPAAGRADASRKIGFDVSNETGGSFQTYFKCLGDEYSMPTPAKRTSVADLPFSDVVLVMFETGPRGERKRAFAVNVPADAPAKIRIKLVTRAEPKGVYIAEAVGAVSFIEINMLTYLNS
jgi:hypothetical protein